MEKREVQELSFRLIGYAGDAYSSFQQAISKARKNEFEESENLIEEGKQQLVKAHNVQTELLTAEVQGEDLAYSILMVHAQDHLMNAVMFESVAKEIIELYQLVAAGKGK